MAALCVRHAAPHVLGAAASRPGVCAGDNVLLQPEGGGAADGAMTMRVKIADFGSASEIDYATSDDAAGGEGMQMRGSPYWMAVRAAAPSVALTCRHARAAPSLVSGLRIGR
jgi:hypothetical protein